MLEDKSELKTQSSDSVTRKVTFGCPSTFNVNCFLSITRDLYGFNAHDYPCATSLADMVKAVVVTSGKNNNVQSHIVTRTYPCSSSYSFCHALTNASICPQSYQSNVPFIPTFSLPRLATSIIMYLHLRCIMVIVILLRLILVMMDFCPDQNSLNFQGIL